jgi:hypothetical protein
MDHELDEIAAPNSEIVRVGSHRGPCDPPPWRLATSDGTFGHRFDDPRAAEGRPISDCFRCIYFGQTEEAAFGEVLAQYQPSLKLLAELEKIDDPETLDQVFAGTLDFEAETGRIRRIVPREWLSSRRICRTTLDANLRFADLTTGRSRVYIRQKLARTANSLGLHDVDFSTILSPEHRQLTQACAAHIHELKDSSGMPRFAGIHYVSRLDIAEWRCWALFDDRVEGRRTPGSAEPVSVHNEALLSVGRRFDLVFQTIDGECHYP